jgi:hypothetical protein
MNDKYDKEICIDKEYLSLIYPTKFDSVQVQKCPFKSQNSEKSPRGIVCEKGKLCIVSK